MTHKPSAKKSSKTQDKKEDKKKNKVHPNPEQEGTKTKNLLLAVTGMSPAVVTETLYGIAQRIPDECDKRLKNQWDELCISDPNNYPEAGFYDWRESNKDDVEQQVIDELWPDEIRIITTSEGKKTLLNPDKWRGGEKNNIFKRVREVCELVGPKNKDKDMPLDESHILVVPDANGKPVEDAREIEDHEALANFITSTVRDFTSGDRWRIHASIAGGRKTMTFYLGYAMSLFGRHFDCMSHVLVDKDFEGGDFFFPYQKDGDSYNVKVGKKDLDSRDATIKLTDIPFIRMRQNLPAILKEGVGSGDTLNYRTLVNLINLGDQPDNIRLRLTPKDGLVELFEGKPESADDQPVAKFTLQNPVYMAIYTAMARVTKQSDKQRCRYVRTVKNGDDDSLLYLDVAQELARVAGMIHSTLKGKALFDELAGKITNDNAMLAKLSCDASIVGADLTDRVSEIRQKIEGSITEQLKYYLIPSSAFNEKGMTAARGKYYGLRLNPEQIEIIE